MLTLSGKSRSQAASAAKRETRVGARGVCVHQSSKRSPAPLGGAQLAAIATAAATLEPGSLPLPVHYDFRTPEYTSYATITHEKWESTRGLGYSFGYNRNETEAALLSVEGLIHSFVDIVSKNGNLLINVGPMADGAIPALQRERLGALGRWLAANGEAIYGTRPWVRAEGRTDDGLPVRFTQRDGTVYAIVLGTLHGQDIAIEDLTLEPATAVHLLGQGQNASWQHQDGGVVITLPRRPANAPAHVLRLTAKAVR